MRKNSGDLARREDIEREARACESRCSSTRLVRTALKRLGRMNFVLHSARLIPATAQSTGMELGMEIVRLHIE